MRFHTSALLALCLSTSALAADPPTDMTNHCGMRAKGDVRPRIGLVLSGGGARGIAHIGVIKALEGAGVHVDCIAGTSMGALVGGFYALGMPVDEMEEIVLSLDWGTMFNDALERPERSIRRKEEDRLSLSSIGVGLDRSGLKIATGVVAGQRIQAFLERSTVAANGVAHFDQLPIPFRAVATDLNTGLPVVLDRGSLATALRASMSLPAVLDPVEIDDQILVDGGLADQLPVGVVRAMGADVVIAVNVGMPLDRLDSSANLLTVINQLTSLMTVGNTRAAIAGLGERDLLITPELGTELGSADFEKGELAIQVGLDAGLAMSERFAELSSSAPERERTLHRDRRPLIDFVRLDNRTPYANEVILSRVDVEIGQPLDMVALENQLRVIYGIGTFASVSYQVVTEHGQTGVVVTAVPKSHGPNYVQIGLALSSDFGSEFSANFRASLLLAPISPLGAEARVFAQIGSEPTLGLEYNRPLDPLSRNALLFRGFYETADVRTYDGDGNNTATYEVRQLTTSAAWVREFGSQGALNIGIRRGLGETLVATGDPALPEVSYQIGDVGAALTLDRLDNLYFPRQGHFARIGMLGSRKALGADSNFVQADLDFISARGFGKHALQYGLRLHSTTSGTAPLQSIYRLGGRGRGIGYRRNELSGQNYAVLIGGYLYELADVMGRSAYFGSTVEFTNAWDQRSQLRLDRSVVNAGVYLGFDSWIGPMLFGYGVRESGDGTLFLEIGQQF
ncbi:MAG: patatin-like phospholipase family protein [Xanthomonadales bacterium]|nr:patatin-like phospholipase family protein [Xanthomonadales bacterium]